MDDQQRNAQRMGRLLRKLRQKKGWTLEETEDHGWHDWKYLQKIETGQNITVATLFKLFEIYGVRSERLIKHLESALKL